jgi:hypothetical protein
MIVDLRCELENERRTNQTHFKIHQSSIKPEKVAVQELDLIFTNSAFQGIQACPAAALI